MSTVDEDFELLRAVAKRACTTSIAAFKFYKGLPVHAATGAKLAAAELSADERARLLAFCA